MTDRTVGAWRLVPPVIGVLFCISLNTSRGATRRRYAAVVVWGVIVIGVALR